MLRLLEDHTVSPSRALGQNFVADANTVRRIARLAGVGPGDRVVEIGAGLGSLTLALVETGATVTAVEVDRWLVPLLRQVLADKAPAAAVTVVEADAMSLDWTALLSSPSPEPAQSLGGWALVANLPYNIATPLVADLLDEVPAIVADLVATMTGADPTSIEVDVKAHAGIDSTRLGLAAAFAVAAAVLWRAIRNIAPVR